MHLSMLGSCTAPMLHLPCQILHLCCQSCYMLRLSSSYGANKQPLSMLQSYVICHSMCRAQVEEGQEAPVLHLSMLEVGGHRFLLKLNQAAIARVFAATRHASLA